MSTITRVHGEPGKPGVFLVPSASQPALGHQVAYQTEGVAYCTCPGFQHRRACVHVEAAAAHVRAEALGRPTTPEAISTARDRLRALERMFS